MTLAEIAATARKCGMSYGQYVAQTRVVVVVQPKHEQLEKKEAQKGDKNWTT